MPRTTWSLFAANIAVFQLWLPAPILGPPVFVATNVVDFEIIIDVATSGHIGLNIVDATNVVDFVIKIIKLPVPLRDTPVSKVVVPLTLWSYSKCGASNALKFHSYLQSYIVVH